MTTTATASRFGYSAAPAAQPGMLQRLSPPEGWLTLAAVLAPLLALMWAVTEAAWAETPSLLGVLAVAALMGLAVAKAPGWQPLWHALALPLGAAFVYWQLSTLSAAQGWPAAFQELNTRLGQWGETASVGGISTDTLPFAVGVTGLAWVIGYVSVWAAFRRRSVWLSVVPGGMAMFSHLSYLPAEFEVQMFVYLALAMLLIVRMNALNQRAAWERRGVTPPAGYGVRAMYRGGWYIALALTVAFLLPVRPWQSPWFDAAWEWTRSPIETLENDLDRLFAALPDRKGGLNIDFGSHLPFQGAISLSDEPLFLMEAAHPAYLRARTYPVYSAQGWTTERVERVEVAESLPWSQPRAYAERQEVEQTITPLVSTQTMPLANLPVAYSGDDAALAHALPPPRFWLPVSEALPEADGLPADLRPMATAVRGVALAEAPEALQAATLTALLPADAVITQVAFRDTAEGGNQRSYAVDAAAPGGEEAAVAAALLSDQRSLAWVQVSRRPPHPPDIVALRSDDKLGPGDAYSVTSTFSTATPEQLREAGEDYPGWVRDRYLQLPDSQPFRVRNLAQRLTEGLDTPYAKAKAIETYLRRLGYDQKIPAPPYNVDGVEHFLFELERGYSEYFGSAMAVLLREAGIPARLVVGYTPREFDPVSGHWVVREADSHGWAEAYFPGYGWVEFEPTPNWETPASIEAPILNPGGVSADGAVDVFDEDEFFEDEGFVPIGGVTSAQEPVVDGRIAAALAGGFAIVVALWYAYRRVFVRVQRPAAVFERMCWLGAWSGLRHLPQQTPGEYTARLAAVFPGAAGDLRILGNAHAVARYSRRDITEREAEQVQRAWTHVRRLLFRRALWRLPLG